MEDYRHEIFVLASLLNITCCAYPLMSLFKMKAKDESDGFPYEPLKFSHFCMVAWFTSSLQTHDFEYISPAFIGLMATASCLFFHSNLKPGTNLAFQDFMYGVYYIMIAYFLPQNIVNFIACVLTVKLYLFGWTDLQGLLLNNNWNEVDLVENGLNLLNTVFWIACGVLDGDYLAVFAFLTGSIIYSLIIGNYFLNSTDHKKKVKL